MPIVFDMARIVIHTNFTNMAKQIYEISLDDLLTPAGIKRLRAAMSDEKFRRWPEK